MLHLYNTLTRTKARFIPIEPGKVRMYVCGMTVYDYCHLGHARVLVVFDMVVRYLRARDYQVTYVRNVTDIDDKIIKRANENGEPMDALTGRFIQAMHEDADVLGVLRPDQEPRATLYMREIIDMIATLMERGYAYAAANGDVYYHVRKFADYGQLSGKALDDLRVGARVEADEMKQDPLDFVLWKAAKPGEPRWDSPWGAGRPGWHIECSAMSTACLGQHFDIHGGGLDLQFPHHENEIAQSEGASGHKFVNVWMHNGFVRMDNEKMSKSLGNFFTIREVLKKYDPEVVRYFILASHYHSPLNYAEDSLDNAKAALTRLYTALTGNRSCVFPKEPDASTSAIHGGRKDLLAATDPVPADAGGVITMYEQSFFAAMDDDFNTPVALAVLFDLARDINRLQATDVAHAHALGGELRKLAGILGLLQREPQVFLQGGPAAAGLSVEQIEVLIGQRVAARKNKQWAESDRIRDELKARGVMLEDAGGATTWRRL